MPSLKELRVRINSVKSTRKITAAMKMVAAAKLRRAQEQAENGRPYAERMGAMLQNLSATVDPQSLSSPLLKGTGNDNIHLLVVITSDRGLCGAFNSSVVREARRAVLRLEAAGRTVKILCVGRKGRDGLKKDCGKHIVKTIGDLGKPRLSYADAQKISDTITEMFAAGAFDICSVIYNEFRSVISQVVTTEQLIPVALPANDNAAVTTPYIYEPDEAALIEELLPKNLLVKLYTALLESAASEQGARMTAMDNATRNAGDMIKGLTLNYNRTRQAYITKELIEIISGAEAL